MEMAISHYEDKVKKLREKREAREIHDIVENLEKQLRPEK